MLVGLKSPGTVNLPTLGTIHLEKIDDTLAEQLFLQGMPFIKPVMHIKKPLKKVTAKVTDHIAFHPPG